LAFWAWVSGDIDTAQGLFAEALRLDPMSAVTHNNFAIMYRDLGQPERARELLEKALALPREMPSHRTRNNLSMVALQQGRVDEAVRLSRQAVEGAPGVADFRVQLALALGAQGDAAAAKAATQELLRLAPHYRLRRPAANAPPVFAWYAGYFASTLEPAARVAGLPVEDWRRQSSAAVAGRGVKAALAPGTTARRASPARWPGGRGRQTSVPLPVGACTRPRLYLACATCSVAGVAIMRCRSALFAINSLR
jgi:tetratricopeptide (TPR) repeat protein